MLKYMEELKNMATEDKVTGLSTRAYLDRRLAEVEVAWGVFERPETERFAAVMPGLATIEKAGTYIQCDGVTQSFEAVVQAHGASASVKKILDGMRLKANAPILAAREVARDSV